MNDEALLIPIFALMIPLAVAPTAIVVKYLRYRRDLQHRERMKALEMGVVPYPTSHWPAAFAVVGIGVGVPVGSFLVAWFATLTSHLGEEVFAFAMIVSIVALVQGGRLVTRLLPTSVNPADRANDWEPRPYEGKSRINDPDAFDVVSRRG